MPGAHPNTMTCPECGATHGAHYGWCSRVQQTVKDVFDAVDRDIEYRRQRIAEVQRQAADRMRAFTLAAIQAATGEAFDPDKTRVLTTLETIKACRAIVTFLREVEHHGGTLTTWRERIETIVDFTTGTLRG